MCYWGRIFTSSICGNYYCELGTADKQNDAAYYFSDPLWDRSGSQCCSKTTQLWFYHELSTAITADIEAIICKEATNNGLVLIDQLEFYIQ